MTVGIVITVWNNKHTYKQNLLGTVVTIPTVITLSPTLQKVTSHFILLKIFKSLKFYNHASYKYKKYIILNRKLYILLY